MQHPHPFSTDANITQGQGGMVSPAVYPWEMLISASISSSLKWEYPTVWCEDEMRCELPSLSSHHFV